MLKRIADLPKTDRPRERLMRKGAASLSDQELLAVLLGQGARGVDVMALAKQLARVIDKKGPGICIGDLTHCYGVGDAKASLILAALEFARRRIQSGGVKIDTPVDLLAHIRHFADRKQEHLLCVSLNGANEILAVRVASIGLVDRTPVHPREIFADPVTDRASAVIIAHNHPMGPLAPSQVDVASTKRLRRAGEILGITLLDHLIFNRVDHFSFREAGVVF